MAGSPQRRIYALDGWRRRKGWHSIGQTDELGYKPTQSPVHVHDFNATILHLLGIDHERLTYKFQGRKFRLTDVHGHVQHQLLA